MGSINMKKYEDFLIEANKISFDFKTKKNFFDVAGYPHYENVISNILAFLFNTEEEHGLSDLWVSSLIECYKAKSQLDLDKEKLRVDSQNIVSDDVIREERTKESKRIDILIKVNDGLLIGIENKIFSSADYNPFDAYVEHIKKIAKHDSYNKTKMFVILSIRKEKIKESRYNIVNITYSELFYQIEKKVGKYLQNSNEKWLIYMNEFLKNIKGLEDQKMNEVDREWYRFITEKDNEIKDMIDKYIAMISNNKSLLKQCTDELNSWIEEKYKQYGDFRVNEHNLGKSINFGHSSLYIDFDSIYDGLGTIVYEPYVMSMPKDKKDDETEKVGYLYLAIWNRKKELKTDFEKIYASIKKRFEDNGLKDINEFKISSSTPGKSGNGWGKYIVVKTIPLYEYNKNEFIEISKIIIDALVEYNEKQKISKE